MANGKKFPVQIVIGAVDDMTLKVMAINEKLKKITGPISKVGESLSLFGREMGFGKIGAAIGNVHNRFSSFAKELSKAGLVAAGIGYSLFRLVKGSADFGDQIGDASQRIGISTKAFQVWNHQAAQADLTAEELESSLIRFSKAMGQAGIKGKMEDVLPRLAAKLSKVKNETERNKILFDAFGKSGPKMAAFLDRVAKSGGNLEKEFQKLLASGDVISEDQIRAADEFNNQWALLTKKIEVFKMAALSEMMPVLLDLLRQASEWLGANREKVAAWAQEFAKGLPGIVQGVTTVLRSLGTVFGWVSSTVGVLNDWFGAANVTAGILAATIFGKTIVSFVQLGASLFQLAGAAIPMLVKAFGLLWPILTKLTVMLLANPIGIWIAAGAALVGLGVLLYKKWEPFRNLIDGIVDKAKAIGGWIGDKLGITGGSSGTAAAGPAIGGAEATETATAALGPGGGNAHVTVDFANMPKGTRVKTEKADVPIDLNMGYAMGTP